MGGDNRYSTSSSNRKRDFIFISYASEDESYARKLYDQLRHDGFLPWLDKENILPGQNWQHEIKNAIRNSRIVIILFSSNLINKISFIQKELREAIPEQQNFPPSLTFIIPARLDECDIPHEELEKIQYVDLFPDWDAGFSKISKSLDKSFVSQAEKQNSIDIDWIAKVKEDGKKSITNF
jgi:hypothetical protein